MEQARNDVAVELKRMTRRLNELLTGGTEPAPRAECEHGLECNGIATRFLVPAVVKPIAAARNIISGSCIEEIEHSSVLYSVCREEHIERLSRALKPFDDVEV